MLSLVVITRDEADRLAACLRSVPIADEIIVLDSGSSDGTPAVARECGADVRVTDWPGYVAQKNRALLLAKGPWVLSLDADERLSPEAVAEVRAALAEPGAAVAFSFPRRNRWLGRVLRWGRPGRERKIRLVLKDRAAWRGDDPHDTLVADGPVVRLDGPIDHDPHRDLSGCLRTVDEYSRLGAAVRRQRGERSSVLRVLAAPVWAFVHGYVLLGGWLDGAHGLGYAALDAASTLLKHARTRTG